MMTLRLLLSSGLSLIIILTNIGCSAEEGLNSAVDVKGQRKVLDHASELISTRVSPTMEIGIKVTLIGEEDGLRAISDDEMGRIVSYSKRMIGERSFALRLEKDSPDFRNDLCAEINRELQRDTVVDVKVYGFSFTEYRPPLTGPQPQSVSEEKGPRR
jgi:hypothetical protein